MIDRTFLVRLKFFEVSIFTKIQENKQIHDNVKLKKEKIETIII